ncbi:MAG: fatty acyl-AMP ligase [Actinomycetota bacterium]
MHAATLTELVAHAADQSPDRGYNFLHGGDDDLIDSLSFADLAASAKSIAEELLAVMAPASRALLVYPPGLEFLPAFFGAVSARVIAVPLSPPMTSNLSDWVDHVDRIIADAQPDAVLTTGEFLDLKRDTAVEVGPPDLEWLATDRFSAAVPTPGARGPRADDIAFVQYTSGSTGRPKGVVVRHANLLANLRLLADTSRLSRESVGVSWLPLYHDMGLIGFVLQALYGGCQTYLVSPLEFLQRPATWLEMITRFGGNFAGAPSFAYELCVKRVSETERQTLDLSTWESAYNGAEPVRAATLRRFIEMFADVGFDPGAFVPCYGLAESTLITTGHRSPDGPQTLRLSRDQLAKGEAHPAVAGDESVEIVALGRAPADHDVVVVDSETADRFPDGRVGEIWLRGPSVTSGYWREPEGTADLFAARLRSGEGPYLRTGDLGFLLDGELFVTGRLKDLIIVRGRNIVPHDIEDAVQQADRRLRAGCGAAFAIEGADSEEVVVLVQESSETDPEHLLELIRVARDVVTTRFQIPIAAVVLVAPRTLPKTSSGKLQRYRCRDLYLTGELSRLADWSRAAEAPVDG